MPRQVPGVFSKCGSGAHVLTVLAPQSCSPFSLLRAPDRGYEFFECLGSNSPVYFGDHERPNSNTRMPRQSSKGLMPRQGGDWAWHLGETVSIDVLSMEGRRVPVQ